MNFHLSRRASLVSFLGILLSFLLYHDGAHAAPAISEVLWMGSDLSTADEWVEMTNPSDAETLDLSGWTLWTLSSKGDDTLIVRFLTGTTLEPGASAIIANAGAAASRLLDEPDVITTAMSLPNTKLRLTLRDHKGSVVDQVDDGIGAPFAGANPSGGTKASMERIDLLVAGTEPTNWRSATRASGLDDGANLLATPGSFDGFMPSPPSQSSSSSSSACADPLTVAIYVQDGALTGIDKTTVNFQAVATEGSISGVPCTWTFSDGYRSSSCNPPPHAFTMIGTTNVLLEAINQCGTTLKQEVQVRVSSSDIDPTLPSLISSYPPSLVLVSALPNPVGSDSDREWVKIRNVTDATIALDGWTLAIGLKKFSILRLTGTIGPREMRTIHRIEQKISLPNSASKIFLRSPDGSDVSRIEYDQAEEDRAYFPLDLRDHDVSGTVSEVLDGDSFYLTLSEDYRTLMDEENLRVRLLGIDAPDLLLIGGDVNGSLSSKDFLRDLVANQKVELEFDTEMWDAQGALLAYVYLPHRGLLQDILLTTGHVTTNDTIDCVRCDEFAKQANAARQSRLGIWSLPDAFASMNAMSSDEAKDRDIAPSFQDDRENISLPPSAAQRELRISEISSVTPQPFDPALPREWLELWNPTDEPVSLAGLSLARGGKIRQLPAAEVVPASGYFLFDATLAKLGLPDDGTTIDLLASDGAPIDSVQFPKLSANQSFALDPRADSYCITRRPTPEAQNICLAPLTRQQKSKAAASNRSAIQYQAYADSYQNELDKISEDSDINVFSDNDGFLASQGVRMSIAFLVGALLGIVAFLVVRWGRLL